MRSWSARVANPLNDRRAAFLDEARGTTRTADPGPAAGNQRHWPSEQPMNDPPDGSHRSF